MPNVFFQTLSIGRVHIQFLGCWLIIFYFYSYFKRTFCKQTVANLIRRRVLRRLIWFCNVYRCPIKRTLGLYGLNCFVALCLMRVLSLFNMVACLCHFVIISLFRLFAWRNGAAPRQNNAKRNDEITKKTPSEITKRRNNARRKDEKTKRRHAKRRNNATRNNEITPCEITKKRQSERRQNEI